jgi:LPS O-antigen subunit length determinant protein (WzzB/FepE family)
MKKKKYLHDESINLGFFIQLIWKEKILVLIFSSIFFLVAYLYTTFSVQKVITQITFKNPPSQLFEHYSFALNISDNANNNNANNNNANNNNANNNNANNIIAKQFIYEFESKFLSLDYLESFIEQSRDFDYFKEYLKLRNTTSKEYFTGYKFGNVKENSIIVPNKYFLVLPEKIDEIKFISNYLQFIKSIAVIEFKKNLKLSIENQINIYEQDLEIAKIIQLENPIIKSTTNFNLVINEPDPFYYKGTKVLSQQIVYLKKTLLKLEKDQFNHDFILEIISRPSSDILENQLAVRFFGFLFGLFLSIIIISIRAGLQVGIKL